MYDVSTGAAYAVLYSVLALFTVLAIISAGYFGKGRVLRKLGLIMLPKGGEEGEEGEAGGSTTADFFLAARNSASTKTIALSFFASQMGAWVVYAPTELGANPQLSWIAIIGYALASASTGVIIFFIGPYIRKLTGEKAFSTTDFALVRYGRVIQLAVAIMSVFYMFIYMVAELTAISNIFGLVCNVNTFDTSTMSYTTSIAVSVAVFTWFYTSIAGLPGSLVTDKFQAWLMIILILILLIVACSNPQNQLTKEEFSVASNWTGDGAMAAVTLIIAVISAEMFNQANWQRVWAAKDVPSMRKGFAWGSFLIFLLMMFFGIMGMISFALDPENYLVYNKFYYLAFFDLLAPLSQFWHIVVLIVCTALAASTVDSVQTAIASVVSSDFIRYGVPDKWATLITRVLLVIINVPAVIMSSKRYDVLGLFLVADLVCSTALLPVFFGLITKDIKFIPAPTEVGAFLGIWSGIGAVLVNGHVIGFTEAVNPITGQVVATGPWSYFWLTNSTQCALCGSTTMVTFIITPLVAGFFTFFFSKIDIMIRGERARKPIFLMTQPEEEAKNYNLVDGEEQQEEDGVAEAVIGDDLEKTEKDDSLEEHAGEDEKVDSAVEVVPEVA
ncbi:hypothetical protein ACHAWC_008209 [Mediolabrus comicus]